MHRRNFIKTGAAIGAFSTGALTLPENMLAGELKGNINHSVCKWCYSDLTVEQLSMGAAKMGIKSVELLHPADWPTLKKYGLICAMANGPDTGHDALTVGFNRLEHHEFLVPGYKKRIQETADAGFPSVICFSGNRKGLDDDIGMKNCEIGIKKIVGEAEKHGILLTMELLNSKPGGHVDYQCDHTPWGVELIKRVGSPNFKLLYDIYHMQIMDGDIIRTIRENHEFIGHYHTGGNPGRNEIDETQELNYRAIMKAIVETGFKGYVAQEFIPKRAPFASLGQAVSICDV